MKQKLAKRGLVLILAAAMTTGLTACGSKSIAGDGEEQRYFKAEYIDSLPESFSNLNSVKFVGDTVYYQGYDSDYTKNGIYSYNLTTQEEKTYWEGESNNSDPLAESIGVNSFTVDEDGNVYLYIYSSQLDADSIEKDYSDTTYDDIIAYMMDSWGYTDQENAENDWNEYYSATYTDESGEVNYGNALLSWESWTLDHTQKYSLRKIDAAGNQVYDVEIAADGTNYVNCYNIETDKDNNLYALINEWGDENDSYYVKIVDENGEEKGKIDLINYTDSLIPLADGTVATLFWGDNGNYQLSILDSQTMQIGESFDLGQGYAQNLQALDEDNVLMTENGTVYQYNLKTQEKEKYFSWMDCNISRNNVSGFGMLSDGRIAAYIQTYDYSTWEASYEIALINEVDASEVKDVKTLNLACIYMDSDLEMKIIEYNKTHDDYRIVVEEFYNSDTDMDYVDALNSYVTAIASNPDIDMIVLSSANTYADIMNYASKGLLIDMYELMDADEEISREDFIQSILSACEYDGKLVTLPNGFALQTVVGKESDVGSEPGWTLDDMQALLASKEEGTQLFYGMTRSSALNVCLNLGYKDFIDLENTTCNFDSEEFVKVLEFANMFPEEFEWNADEDETVLMNTGKVLLAEYYLSDFDQIQMYTEIFGGKLTYIGYPTSEGNGAMLNLGNCYGITKNCEDKEAAWELIREFFLPKDENSSIYYSSGMSIRQDDFEKFCEEAMKDDGTRNSSWGWGSFYVELKPATQDQVDEVKDLLANATAIYGAVSTDITNIIEEEAAAYFAGQKSAEDVAEIIQSRIQVYLSETK